MKEKKSTLIGGGTVLGTEISTNSIVETSTKEIISELVSEVQKMEWGTKLLLLEVFVEDKKWDFVKAILSCEKHIDIIKNILSSDFKEEKKVSLIESLINNVGLNWKLEESNNFSEYNAIIKNFHNRFFSELRSQSLITISKNATWISRNYVILDLENRKQTVKVISETPDEAQKRICDCLGIKKLEFLSYEIPGGEELYRGKIAQNMWSSRLKEDPYLLIRINISGLGKGGYSDKYVGRNDYLFDVIGKSSVTDGIYRMYGNFQYDQTFKAPNPRILRPEYSGNYNPVTLIFKAEKV